MVNSEFVISVLLNQTWAELILQVISLNFEVSRINRKLFSLGSEQLENALHQLQYIIQHK